MRRQFHLDRFEEWFIRRKAKQLVGKAGITKSQRDDVAQDLRTDVIDRLDAFDPVRSNRHTFVAMTVKHGAARILERRLAAKRAAGREQYSLNSTVTDLEGSPVERHQLLADDRPGRPEGEDRDLVNDVREVIAGLPAAFQEVCRHILAGKTVKQTAAALGIPRTTLYRDLRAIKTAFEGAGLGAYFREK